MKFALDKKFRECYFDYSEWKIREEKEPPRPKPCGDGKRKSGHEEKNSISESPRRRRRQRRKHEHHDHQPAQEPGEESDRDREAHHDGKKDRIDLPRLGRIHQKDRDLSGTAEKKEDNKPRKKKRQRRQINHSRMVSGGGESERKRRRGRGSISRPGSTDPQHTEGNRHPADADLHELADQRAADAVTNGCNPSDVGSALSEFHASDRRDEAEAAELPELRRAGGRLEVRILRNEIRLKERRNV